MEATSSFFHQSSKGEGIMKKIFVILLFISISISFLTMSIEQNAYDINYYKRFYRDNKIDLETGKSQEELEEISQDLILYLKYKGDNEILERHFNHKEVLHMVDVQNLFRLNRFLKYLGIGTYLFILIFLHKKLGTRTIGKTFLYGPLVNYGIFLIFGLLATLDFNKYFTYFHHIFFTNDLWLLDPNTDLMIQMLPENFFMGMAKNILLSFLLYMVILQIVGYFYKRKGGKENERKSTRSRKENKRTFNKK